MSVSSYERAERAGTLEREERWAGGAMDQIIAYENGDLDEDGTVELFQYLVDSGLAWSLQGSYGRMAMRLIEAGLVRERR
jgi:hypothetical protein